MGRRSHDGPGSLNAGHGIRTPVDEHAEFGLPEPSGPLRFRFPTRGRGCDLLGLAHPWNSEQKNVGGQAEKTT